MKKITNSICVLVRSLSNMSSLKVKVNQGVVRGCKETLPDGRSFLRFSGIPYAKPPINELRFRSPQKLLKFNENEIDCTREGDACFHLSVFTQSAEGSEDCLYLNVYIPEAPKSGHKLPVMVYIHGGGFTFDSGTINMYSPEHLMMEDVIVVTVNYRLHVLGFLSLPSMGISGNAGLKDQQMALEWVHENIAYFNGDPDNICLFGESAGGASVHLQVLNVKSRRFLKTAICQSGCALGDWVVQDDGVGVSRKLAKYLGCTQTDDESVYRTLMEASADQLFSLKLKPQSSDEKRRNLPFAFKPIVEDASSNDAFMIQWPIELIKSQKDQIKFPVMFGITDKDGAIMTASYRHMLAVFDSDPVKLVPRSVKVDPSAPLAKSLGEEIKKFYFGDEAINEDMIPRLVDHMTDFHFLTPQTIANELNAQYQANSKQFLYEFQFDGQLNHYKKFINMSEIDGAVHADDLSYLFHQRILGEIDVDSRSTEMRKLMCKLWTNFAKYHDPTPEHDNPLGFRWNPIEPVSKGNTAIDLDYLVINDEMKMVRNLSKDRMDFWRNVYEEYNTSVRSKL